MRKRQVHLDFHTSPYITDVASQFNAKTFAKMLKDAHVNSVTCFARDHHGYLWYPSKRHPELIHPHAKINDLLIQQIDACHALDIKVPIYTTVQWDEYCEINHPEWLCRDPEGNKINAQPAVKPPHFYYSLCLNSNYRHYFFDHLADLIESVGKERIDGLFLDIFFPVACDCIHCQKEMQRLGFDHTNKDERLQYSLLMLDQFKHEVHEFVEQNIPGTPLFFNGSHIGPEIKRSLKDYDHLEIESLPGGIWGYDNFPLVSRYARTLGLNMIGMTGKFHTYWGDMHSFKNPLALQYEVFQMLSFGAGCSIGDQLHPNGALSPVTYNLIGSVYKVVEDLEPHLDHMVPQSEIAIITPEHHWDPQVGKFDDSLIGCNRLLDELGYQFDIIDDQSDFSKYHLLVLPDDIVYDPNVHQKLMEYVQNGGKILTSFQAEQVPEMVEDQLTGNETHGYSFWDRDYILPNDQIGKNLPKEEHVMYEQGMRVLPVSSQEILQTREPYFNREGKYFSSHQHAPSTGHSGEPGATRKGNVIYFSHPIFKIYNDYAPQWIKQIVHDAINLLLPNPLIKKPLEYPSLSVQYHKGAVNNRINVHLLDYQIKKNATHLYTIDECIPLHDLLVSVKVDSQPINHVKALRSGQELTFNKHDNYIDIELPVLKGYEVISIS